MKTQHFDILIHAPPKQVWATMLQSPTYERWTTAFCEGSRFEGSWDEGQTIRFLNPQGLGMVAERNALRMHAAAIASARQSSDDQMGR